MPPMPTIYCPRRMGQYRTMRATFVAHYYRHITNDVARPTSAGP